MVNKTGGKPAGLPKSWGAINSGMLVLFTVIWYMRRCYMLYVKMKSVAQIQFRHLVVNFGFISCPRWNS
jgi:hypothetical protein